jgi:hypothetical protein
MKAACYIELLDPEGFISCFIEQLMLTGTRVFLNCMYVSLQIHVSENFALITEFPLHKNILSLDR